MAKSTPTKVIYRSAVTGEFVPKTYADKHPRTTERERVYIHPPTK